MTPEETHQPDYSEWQKTRWKLEGKGGDGDPPYARDVSLLQAEYARRALNTIDPKQPFRYKREGD